MMRRETPGRSSRAWPVLWLLAGAAACSYADSTAPGQPRFDLAPGPVHTRAAAPDLTGTAEYGARLELERTPAFPSPMAAITADPWAGTFRFRAVPLAEGRNQFVLTATDDAGNRSEPALLEVDFENRPSELRLTLSTSLVIAGTGPGRGTLLATAEVLGADEGYDVKGRTVSFGVQDVGTQNARGTTDEKGVAEALLTGLTTAGEGKVVATLGDLSAERTFLVTGGAPSALTLTLSPAGSTSDGLRELQVSAGTDVVATVNVQDSVGNPVDAPVTIYTDAPGAFVEGHRLTHVQKVGTWHVAAAVNGAATAGSAGVSDAATLVVGAGPAAAVTLGVPAAATAGVAVPYTVTLADAFGNGAATGPGQTVSISSSDPRVVVSDAAKTATFKAAGAQTLVATLTDGTSSAGSTRTVAVSPAVAASVTVALRGTDVVTGTPALDVRAGDGLPGSSCPTCGTLTVTAEAMDEFGNRGAGTVLLTTDAQGRFEANVLRGLVKAGSFTVRAAAAGTAADATAGFNVVAAEASAVDLRLASGSATAGVAVGFTASVQDRFGNATADAVAVTVDGVGAGMSDVDRTARTLTVRQAGAFTVRASPAGASPAPATAPLVVAPAAPASVTVQVGPQNNVRAGDAPTFTATVSDAFGNVVAAPPMLWFVVPQAGTIVTGSGPVVSAGRIYNLVRPGTYLCIAQVAGTEITNNLADLEALLTVTPADAASVDLVLARAVADAGSPVDFRVDVADAWGNPLEDAGSNVAVMQGSATPVPTVAGSSWTAAAAGAYTMVATLQVGTQTLSDSEPLTILPVEDTTPPVLHFDRPVADPVVLAWPPPDRMAPVPACAAGVPGDTASVTVSDPSLASRIWLSAGGLLSVQPAVPTLDFPDSPVKVVANVCEAVSAARGEVLLDAAAMDTRGNYVRTGGGWCIDPDYRGYQPANSTAGRCRVHRDAGAGAGNLRALAANGRGDLAAAREGTASAAIIQRFARSGGAYGLGQGHLLAGWQSPSGVAFSGGIALTAVSAAAESAIVRTRDLAADGSGVDDDFVRVAGQGTFRFGAVATASDGSLWATWLKRDASDRSGSKVVRFAGALDLAVAHTELPATGSWAAPADMRLAGLCRGTRDDEFYVFGTTGGGASSRATVVRLSAGTFVPLFTDAETGRDPNGCALTSQGLAVTLSRTGSSAGLVALVDTATGRLATTSLLSGWNSNEALERPAGIALHLGRLFVASSEAGAGSIVRLTRDGGF